jgi:hypothetical protein
VNLTAARLRRLHSAAMLTWLLLLAPSLLWWRESLVWIVGMSWYANFVGHWSSWQAARSEEASE